MSTTDTAAAPASAPARVWEKKDSYGYDEIIEFAKRSFGDDLPPLPLPPMLMLHRVVEISEQGGEFGKGHAVAEYDVQPDDWFFKCHFKGNPLMPGALGFDGVMQLTGFCLAWRGARGDGMALSFGGGKFRGKVTPKSKLVRFRVDIKHVRLTGPLAMIKTDAKIWSDGELIQEMTDFSVGVARNTAA